MADFNRDNRGQRSSRGGGRGFDRRDSGPRQMYSAVCSNCGKECEVPFQPTSGKPVFCNDCFREQRGGSDRPARSEGRDDRRGSDRGDRRSDAPRGNGQAQFGEQLAALNSKLDRIIGLLESSATKPEKAQAAASPRPSRKVEELELSPEEPTVLAEKPKRTRKAAPSKVQAEVQPEEQAETPTQETPSEEV